jgi:hypothetical protein
LGDAGTGYDGTATCRAGCDGAPRTGLFSLELAGGPRTFPKSACISNSVDGTLTFTSTDTSVPGSPPIRVATLFGNSVYSRGYTVRTQPGSPPIRTAVSAFVS